MLFFSKLSFPSAFILVSFHFSVVSFSFLVLTRLYISSLFPPEACIDGIAKYIPSSLLFTGGTRNQFLNNRPLSLVPLSLFLLFSFSLTYMVIIPIFLTDFLTIPLLMSYFTRCSRCSLSPLFFMKIFPPTFPFNLFLPCSLNISSSFLFLYIIFPLNIPPP